MCYSLLTSKDLRRLQQIFDAEPNVEAIDIFAKRVLAEPKRYSLSEQVFPLMHIPIIHRSASGLTITPMRYGFYEPSFISPEMGGAFNAQRKELSSPYWSEAFGAKHGLAVVWKFRMAKLPTESTQSDFKPVGFDFLLAPVLYSERTLSDGFRDYGCAIITDEPHNDVRAAGHDRTPNFLYETSMMLWLNGAAKPASDLQSLLDHKPQLHYQHDFV